MKKSLNNSSIYLADLGGVVNRIPMGYTKKTEKKLSSYSLSLDETKKHVSVWLGDLFLNIVPKNLVRSKKATSKASSILSPIEKIKAQFNSSLKNKEEDGYKDPLVLKRTESIQRFERLGDILQSLKEDLDFFLENYSHHDTIRLKREFYRIIKPLYLKIKLDGIADSIGYLKSACDKARENPGQPGRSYPALYEVVWNLYDVWKKCKKGDPTLTTKLHYVAKHRYTQKYAGKFLEYITLSIKFAIPYPGSRDKIISKKRNEIRKLLRSILEGTLASIVKKVIHNKNLEAARRKSLVKTSSK
ncbi:MAG: hypothetical protein WCK61_01265 [Candidatus Omnitrophota bacterium]